VVSPHTEPRKHEAIREIIKSIHTIQQREQREAGRKKSGQPVQQSQ
jgi:hypothetical protein